MLNSRYSRFTLKRKTTPDDPFSAEPTLTVIKVSKGFIQPVNGAEVFSHLKADQKATHRMYCPLSVPAIYGDIVEQSGQLYNVEYADQPNGISAVGHHKEILLSRYGNGS